VRSGKDRLGLTKGKKRQVKLKRCAMATNDAKQLTREAQMTINDAKQLTREAQMTT